jgi:putative nucleotidyltransferase with HDIG domain
MLSGDVAAHVRELESKDLSTAAHTWRVVLYARALAEDAGVEPEVLERMTYGAAVHDIGKLIVPDAILQKPGPLTTEEFDIIKLHPMEGFRRLREAGEKDDIILSIVRHHHERIDGLGYPDGLKGDAIPLAARYFAVVDAFDALTSIRPYRMEIGHDAGVRAIADLRAGINTRYCGEAVERFAALFVSGQIEWILSHFNDSCPVPEYAHLSSTRDISTDRHPLRFV